MKKERATPDKILRVATKLFAIKGFDGASLREITRGANTNLASINYHFGSKEALYSAVITRYLRPLNETRIANLKVSERLAGNSPVPLPQIIEIWIQPFFEPDPETTEEYRYFHRIIGRSMAEPLPFLIDLLSRELHPTVSCFGQAIRRHVPSLPPEDFLWRMNFVVGALQHTLATMHHMKDLTHGICRSDDHDGTRQRFIDFAVSALLTADPRTNRGR